MSARESRNCFVIMPFGIKTTVDGNEIDFDLVYEDIIREPVEALGFKSVRCDEIARAGTIHRDMFHHIATDDIAVVDLTLFNPNVFYELGVRHALKPAITILIKRRGAAIPFNIQSERIIEYPSESGSYGESRSLIKAFIQAGLGSNSPDSPIFGFLQDARKDWKSERISLLEDHPYRLTDQPGKRICILTGDLRERRNIDVWVNSENTNMQMARFFDRSLSAIIRYEGAEKDDNGEVVEDTIAVELKKVTQNRESVTPGTIYVTGSGALARTRGVKKVFHAAAVYGVPGSGYQVIQEVEKCVTAALRRMDHEQYRADDLRTIVFPMMGTGVANGRVEVIAPCLIQAAITYLCSYPESRVTTVYFSAWNYRDLEACLAALTAAQGVEPVRRDRTV